MSCASVVGERVDSDVKWRCKSRKEQGRASSDRVLLGSAIPLLGDKKLMHPLREYIPWSSALVECDLEG